MRIVEAFPEFELILMTVGTGGDYLTWITSMDGDTIHKAQTTMTERFAKRTHDEWRNRIECGEPGYRIELKRSA